MNTSLPHSVPGQPAKDATSTFRDSLPVPGVSRRLPWWTVGLAALATFVLGAVIQRWQEKRRGTPQQAAEHAAIHALWRLARQIPAKQLLHDPVTGQYLGVNRHHTFVEVLVSDIDFTRPDLAVGAGVTAYWIGAAGRPMSAPILRQHYPADPDLLPDRTWQQVGELLEFND